MKLWNKLVRDHIPEIIEADGSSPVTQILALDDFREALFEKLREESVEFKGAAGEEVASEAADLLEVIEAICTLEGVSMDTVLAAKLDKRTRRGGFEKRIFLVSTEHALT